MSLHLERVMHSDGLRSFLKQFVPKRVLDARQQRRWESIRRHYASLSVADAFSRTYQTKLWGEAQGEKFCSGGGSDECFAIPYVEWVTKFVGEQGIRSVVDLGCGDFRVGRRLCANSEVRYIGADVVPELVAYNSSLFGCDRVAFRCINIIEDDLPDGELCVIRQVLQHLSNAEISQVLKKCEKYPYLLVTEDIYNGRRVRPNLDHVHGPDNRLHKRSGVFLELPPYALNAEVVLELPCPETSSILRTLLIRGASREAEQPWSKIPVRLSSRG